ncbi:MAG: LytTR family transcriptional regulator [Cognatishimia sp.]|uniref:LytTR family DNA-binding domain-containing protein n=1 Tax=Cognatishimia sp. TaxID=2211648 RepID=UPI003B8C5E8B
MRRQILTAFTENERVAIRGLRKAAVLSFGTAWVQLLTLGITAFVAFVAPRAIPTDSILTLWTGTIGLALVSISYQLITGPIIAVFMARLRVTVLISLILNSVIDILILTAIAYFAISEEHFAEHGVLNALARVYVVLFLLTWAFIQVYLSLMQNIFGTIFAESNIPVRFFPQFRQHCSEELQELLPAHLRGPIRYMQAQDKYVQVVTDKGSHLLSTPLTAAISKIDQNRGMRVHRSLWVGWAEIERIVYENGNPRIIGVDGTVWPVSRKHVKHIKATLRDMQ